MSLLAGIKFVKKAPSASVETAVKSQDLEGGGARPEDHEKNRRKRKEHKKDRKEKGRSHRVKVRSHSTMVLKSSPDETRCGH